MTTKPISYVLKKKIKQLSKIQDELFAVEIDPVDYNDLSMTIGRLKNRILIAAINNASDKEIRDIITVGFEFQFRGADWVIKRDYEKSDPSKHVVVQKKGTQKTRISKKRDIIRIIKKEFLFS